MSGNTHSNAQIGAATPAHSDHLHDPDNVAWYGKLLSDVETATLPQEEKPGSVYRAGFITVSIPKPVAEAIHQLAEKLESSADAVLLSCWQILITRYCSVDDLSLIIDIKVVDSAAHQIEAVSILRRSVKETDHFETWIEKTSAGIAMLKDRGCLSLASLNTEFKQEHYRTEASDYGLGYFRSNPPADLTRGLVFSIAADESIPNKLALQALFDQTRISMEDAETILEHYQNLLKQCLANSRKPVGTLPFLNDDEFALVTSGFNNTAIDYPADKSLIDLFEEQVRRCPDRPAVSSEDARLTYAELSDQVTRMTTWLQRFDLKPDDLVAICLPRNTRQLVTQLAVQKAGAAYLPIDPRYPEERVSYILSDASVGLYITDSTFNQPEGFDESTIVLLDMHWSDIKQTEPNTVNHDAGPDDLAYVIYTSGSTGKPKGVEITRKNLVNQLCAAVHAPPVTADDVSIAITTVAFDISIAELFIPLIIGARVHIATSDTAADGFRLKEVLESEGITRLDTTPSTFRLLLEAGWTGNNKLIGQSGGEALSADLVKALVPKLKSFWNSYGPTEATVSCTGMQISDPDQPITIGTPLPNYRMYVLDTNDMPCPVKVTGEICVAGDSVARGYLGRPELNAERFGPDPFVANGSRMYRTGDIGRWLPDGTIECLGRIDNQVKLRGYRIELGEIESLISNQDAVNHSVVTLSKREDTEFLAAYVVLNENHPREKYDSIEKAIIEQLKETLPAYMVPSSFNFIEALPVTPNGKVDYKALPAPDLKRQESVGSGHLASSTEQQIAAMWSELIGISNIGRSDNFFDLGGHSILAMRFINKATEQFDRTINSRLLISADLAKIARTLNPDDIAIEQSANRASQSRSAQPLFLDSGEHRLYAVFHPKTHRDNLSEQEPVLICQPLGHEYQRLHQAVQKLAIQLASSGRDVLRFDYAGTGDSEGVLEEVTLKQWQQNIHDAAIWLREHTAANAVSGIGIRMGGLLLNSTNVATEQLVLWDTIRSGKDWLDTVESMTYSAMQNLDRFSAPLHKRDKCEFFGYQYSESTIASITNLNHVPYGTGSPGKLWYLDSQALTSGPDSARAIASVVVDDHQNWDDFSIADDIALTPKSVRQIIDWLKPGA